MSNDFVPFCPTDTGTNLLTQADYLTDPQLTIGNQPGVARSKLVNKALRQATVIASQLAQLNANITGASPLDDGTTAALIGQFTAAFAPKLPTVQRFLTGSGTYHKSYVFACASASATVGATYTNNSLTFTVVATVASSKQIILTGPGAPLFSGTLAKATGTGDSSIIFYAYSAPLYLEVTMVGGGGGGGGSGTSITPGNGGDGGTTSFGTSLLTCTGGGGGGSGTPTVGMATATAGVILQLLSGASGGASLPTISSNYYQLAGAGGSSPLGGAGAATAGTGINAGDNTGSGASGGGNSNVIGATTGSIGAGGSSGGYLSVILSPALSTYAYAVGAGGTAGIATNGASNGGVGGSGVVLVKELYQ